MKKTLSCLLALVAILIASGCGGKSGGGLLDEISGVWGVQGEQGLFSIIYRDKKLSLLADDIAIPVVLGEIDNENKTVNLNVTLIDGKPGIWTLRQIWDKDHKSFHLQFTFHDGSRSNLTFVRKISTDDLNKIANAEARNQSNAISAAATAKPVEAPPVQIPTEQSAPVAPPTPALVTAPVVEQPQVATNITWAPSFDCAKVSTGPERLICSNKELSEADVKLSQTYKAALNSSPDKDSLKREQNAWRKNERDACADVICMSKAYQQRISQLSR